MNEFLGVLGPSFVSTGGGLFARMSTYLSCTSPEPGRDAGQVTHSARSDPGLQPELSAVRGLGLMTEVNQISSSTFVFHQRNGELTCALVEEHYTHTDQSHGILTLSRVQCTQCEELS